MSRETIEILSGPRRGLKFPVSESLSIGRSPDNILQLNDLQVSRKHAVIQRTPGGTVLQDLGSGNGTFIGNQRILEYRLSDGDIIAIGAVRLKYRSTATEPRIGSSKPSSFFPTAENVVRFHYGEGSEIEASSAENVYRTFFQRPETATSAEELREAQRHLAAVYQANQIISSERDLKKLFERVLDQIFALVPAHNGVIMLLKEETDELVTEHVKTGDGGGEVIVSSTIVSRAFRDGEAVLTLDAAGDDRFDAGASIIAHNISSAMCVPLAHQNETLGVLYVDTRGATNAFGQSDLELLVALAGPAAIAIRNAQYLARLEQAYQDTLTVLASAIEMRDHYTVGHTWRVTNFALVIARQLGWPEEKLKECEMGGVLHDVGKIAVDDAILRKPAGLTDDEYAKMKVHPERGARLLQEIDQLVPLVPYALYHHERFDGEGYPFGLVGPDIPIEGRLIAVADTFDAMTSNRPYRKGLDPEFAISQIEKGKNSQFDGGIVDALAECYRAGRIDEILQEYNKGGWSIACPFCSTFIPIPGGARCGDEFQCAVCHRRVLLRMENDAYFGELIAGTARIEKRPESEPAESPPK